MSGSLETAGGAAWPAPAMDENPGGISGGGVTAHHHVGVAALL
jgi:hypothetical protein